MSTEQLIRRAIHQFKEAGEPRTSLMGAASGSFQDHGLCTWLGPRDGRQVGDGSNANLAGPEDTFG